MKGIQTSRFYNVRVELYLPTVSAKQLLLRSEYISTYSRSLDERFRESVFEMTQVTLKKSSIIRLRYRIIFPTLWDLATLVSLKKSCLRHTHVWLQT